MADDDPPTMAELHARPSEDPTPVAPPIDPAIASESGLRDDELMLDPPPTQRYGGFAGWQAGRRVRWAVVGFFVIAGVIIAVVSWKRAAQREYERLHPLPEVEATIAPGTPREMTMSDGQFRLGLGREAPAVNIIHLPDRDLSLADGQDKAQFKVVVVDGKTIEIVVLTGRIRETLRPGAEPLL